MFTVAVLAFDGVFASALTGVVDLLNLTGVTWNRIHGQPLDQQFKVPVSYTHLTLPTTPYV